MKPRWHVLSSIVAAVLLGGCASQPASVALVPGESHAFLRGAWHGHTASYVERIDGKAVARPVLASDWSRPFPVGAGEHELSVRHEMADSSGGAPQVIRATVKANLVAGAHYAPESRDAGRAMALWIKRLDTSEAASPEGMARKEPLPALQAPSVPFIPPQTSSQQINTSVINGR